MRLSRRSVLKGVTLTLAGLVGGCSSRTQSTDAIAGSIVGGPVRAGHLLRGSSFPPVSTREKASVVVVGGGIAGLSALWELERQGIHDALLLELSSTTGGNATWGENTTSAYPWGAHYVPVASRESTLVQELFRELGVITSPDDGSPPVYREEYLCAEPEERLFRLGTWQPGLLPTIGVSKNERDQHDRFFETVHSLAHRTGSDGRPIFAIPVDVSSTDPAYRSLDTASFAKYLADNGYTSQTLLWYLNYCCRDDYGTSLQNTSAWAGLHYFASRRGWSANASPTDLVTWPGGNGWIVQKLTERYGRSIRTQSLVYSIEPERAVLRYVDLVKGESKEIEAAAVIYAGPRFTAERVVEGLPSTPPIEYRPWMVANLTLSTPPDGPGVSTAWDNVLYDSDSLGYVTATHQSLRTHVDRTVLTYYLPCADEDALTARKRLHNTSWAAWRDYVVADLSRPHRNISRSIERLDVWLWGHGMVAPTPGFVWGESRALLAHKIGRLWFAHSDQSGFSLFEEAQYRGVEAARHVCRFIEGKA